MNSVITPISLAKVFVDETKAQLAYTISINDASVATATVSKDSLVVNQFSAGKTSITVKATNKSGNSATVSFNITVTGNVVCEKPVISTFKKDATCANYKDGFASATVTGGKAPYNFLWIHNGYTGDTLSGIGAGIYTVVVTTKDNCASQAMIEISESAKIIVNETIIQASKSANGSIELSSTQQLTYAWSHGKTSNFEDNLTAGSYTVTISNAKGCHLIKHFDINDDCADPIVIDSISPSKCGSPNGYIALQTPTNSATIAWSDNNSKETKRTNLKAGLYTVTITGACKAVKTIEVTTTSSPAPAISLVTVGKNTGKNTIVWNKQETDQIKYYTIYRENGIEGVYDSIGFKLYSDSSIFRDKEVNPRARSWRYKISHTDVCNTRSELSEQHKTLHLQSQFAVNKIDVNITWTRYEGFTVKSYQLYRKTKNSEPTIIATLPAGISSYTDLQVPNDILEYQVAIVLPEKVDATEKLKSDTGPFSQSLSNMSEASLVSVNSLDCNGVSIWPVPAKNLLHIALANNAGAQIVLFDENGKQVAQTTLGTDAVEIPTEFLNAGLYFLQINTNKGMISKTITIVK